MHHLWRTQEFICDLQGLVVFCMVTESDDLESLFSSDTEDAETGAPLGFWLILEVCTIDVSKELKMVAFPGFSGLGDLSYFGALGEARGFVKMIWKGRKNHIANIAVQPKQKHQ